MFDSFKINNLFTVILKEKSNFPLLKNKITVHEILPGDLPFSLDTHFVNQLFHTSFDIELS